MAEILIIEDDDATRTFFARSLQHFGTVDHAARLDDALQAVDAKRYDVILIDAHLRGRDGLRVLEHLGDEHLNGKTPTFVVTSDLGVGTRLRATRKASFFVQKPVRMPLLVTLIGGVLKLDPKAGASTASSGSGERAAASSARPTPAPVAPTPAAPRRLFGGLSGLWRLRANRSA